MSDVCTDVPSDDPFYGRSAKDGYRTYVDDTNSGSVMTILQKERGEFVTQEPPMFEYSKDSEDTGRQVRDRLLLDSVCRFFNTGGTREQFEHLLNAFAAMEPKGLDFPGYQYFDGYVADDGLYQHIFTYSNQERPDVIWTEPDFDGLGGWLGYANPEVESAGVERTGE